MFGTRAWSNCSGPHVRRIMVQRLRVFVLFAGAAISAAQPFQASAQSIRKQSAEDHVAWVAQGLKRMQTIKPGLARHALLIRVHPRSSAAILPFSSFSPSPSAHFTQFHIDPKRLTS